MFFALKYVYFRPAQAQTGSIISLSFLRWEMTSKFFPSAQTGQDQKLLYQMLDVPVCKALVLILRNQKYIFFF